jgi:hypothetical protein
MQLEISPVSFAGEIYVLCRRGDEWFTNLGGLWLLLTTINIQRFSEHAGVARHTPPSLSVHKTGAV